MYFLRRLTWSMLLTHHTDARRSWDEVEVLWQRQHDGHLEKLRRFRVDDHGAVRSEEGRYLLLCAEGNRPFRQAGRGTSQE